MRLLILFLFVANNYCCAQKDATFKSFLTESNIEFTAPKGFSDLDSIFNINIKQGRRPHQLFYSQINSISDLAIGYYINGAAKEESITYRKEHIFTNYIKSTVDSSLNKPYSLSKEELKKVNADAGVIYDLFTLSRPYRGFVKAKVLILFNKKDGAATVYYFFKEGSEDKVKALMQETAGILKFKGT